MESLNDQITKALFATHKYADSKSKYVNSVVLYYIIKHRIINSGKPLSHNDIINPNWYGTKHVANPRNVSYLNANIDDLISTLDGYKMDDVPNRVSSLYLMVGRPITTIASMFNNLKMTQYIKLDSKASHSSSIILEEQMSSEFDRRLPFVTKSSSSTTSTSSCQPALPHKSHRLGSTLNDLRVYDVPVLNLIQDTEVCSSDTGVFINGDCDTTYGKNIFHEEQQKIGKDEQIKNGNENELVEEIKENKEQENNERIETKENEIQKIEEKKEQENDERIETKENEIQKVEETGMLEKNKMDEKNEKHDANAGNVIMEESKTTDVNEVDKMNEQTEERCDGNGTKVEDYEETESIKKTENVHNENAPHQPSTSTDKTHHDEPRKSYPFNLLSELPVTHEESSDEEFSDDESTSSEEPNDDEFDDDETTVSKISGSIDEVSNIENDLPNDKVNNVEECIVEVDTLKNPPTEHTIVYDVLPHDQGPTPEKNDEHTANEVENDVTQIEKKHTHKNDAYRTQPPLRPHQVHVSPVCNDINEALLIKDRFFQICTFHLSPLNLGVHLDVVVHSIFFHFFTNGHSIHPHNIIKPIKSLCSAFIYQHLSRLYYYLFELWDLKNDILTVVTSHALSINLVTQLDGIYSSLGFSEECIDTILFLYEQWLVSLYLPGLTDKTPAAIYVAIRTYGDDSDGPYGINQSIRCDLSAIIQIRTILRLPGYQSFISLTDWTFKNVFQLLELSFFDIITTYGLSFKEHSFSYHHVDTSTINQKNDFILLFGPYYMKVSDLSCVTGIVPIDKLDPSTTYGLRTLVRYTTPQASSSPCHVPFEQLHLENFADSHRPDWFTNSLTHLTSDMYNYASFGKNGSISFKSTYTTIEYAGLNSVAVADASGFMFAVNDFKDKSVKVYVPKKFQTSYNTSIITMGIDESFHLPPTHQDMARSSSSVGVVTNCSTDMGIALTLYEASQWRREVFQIGDLYNKVQQFNTIFANTPHRLGIDPYYLSRSVLNQLLYGCGISTGNSNFDARRLSRNVNTPVFETYYYSCHLCGSYSNTDFGRRVCGVVDSLRYARLQSESLKLRDKLSHLRQAFDQCKDPSSSAYYFGRYAKGTFTNPQLRPIHIVDSRGLSPSDVTYRSMVNSLKDVRFKNVSLINTIKQNHNIPDETSFNKEFPPLKSEVKVKKV